MCSNNAHGLFQLTRVCYDIHSSVQCVQMKSYIPALSLAGTRCNVCFFTEVGRLGRSSSAAGVRQVGGGDVQRQSSLPAREALNQVNI